MSEYHQMLRLLMGCMDAATYSHFIAEEKKRLVAMVKLKSTRHTESSDDDND